MGKTDGLDEQGQVSTLGEEFIDNSKRLRQAFDLFVSSVQASINEGHDCNVTLKINLARGKIQPKTEIVTAKYPRVD